MKLTVITNGRDDGYGGGDYMERFYVATATNIDRLTAQNIDFEFWIVDWCPLYPHKMIHKHPMFQFLYQNPKVKGIVVDNEINKAEGLTSLGFYEYFAKNIGIRLASSDYVLLTNSDIIFSDGLVTEIKNIVDKPVNETAEYFYRARYRRHSVKVGEEYIEKDSPEQDMHEPDSTGVVVCPGYAGDFLLATKQSLCDKGQGYDETNPAHRSNAHQSGMDGEILWNMYHNGMKLQMFSSPYYHLDHGKFFALDGVYNTDGYKNKEDWGFMKYPQTIEGNITYIKC